MLKQNSDVKRFFEAYARRSNDALQNPPVEDVDGTVASFAPYLVESSPQGVMGGRQRRRVQEADRPGLRQIPRSRRHGHARHRRQGHRARRGQRHGHRRLGVRLQAQD
jgi:hypothetical protein